VLIIKDNKKDLALKSFRVKFSLHGNEIHATKRNLDKLWEARAETAPGFLHPG